MVVDTSPSTYVSEGNGVFAIINAHILTAVGPEIEHGSVMIRDGKIEAVGRDIAVPPSVSRVDADGRYLTPGIIDPHSHVGVSSSPLQANADASNEKSDPAGVQIENSVWTQDPMFARALAAGVTTIQILPGSSSSVNGRTVVLKNIPALSVRGMKFPGILGGLKMACGENPTGGSPGKPSTRAGLMRDLRDRFRDAESYRRRWEAWRAQPSGPPPTHNAALENMAGALDGSLEVHIHCYRADDMMQMIDLAHEFGFKITAFHHATEAFKIAPLLAREHIGVLTWGGDWSGYKMEAYDWVMANAAFVEKAGGVVGMHSDDPAMMQHLNHEAARALVAGQRAGLGTTREQALRWITLNPAKLLGIADKTGSIEAGKAADLVLWDTDPFSIYALPDLVFIDGALKYDRSHPRAAPISDFELGNARRPVEPAFPLPSWGIGR